jgi:hypothetical protein
VTEAFATIDGKTLVGVHFVVGSNGPWYAEVEFEVHPDISGASVMRLGSLELKGTLTVESSGTFGLQRKARFVAGANGWSVEASAKNYHNDAGVKARTVVEDVAREVGESIGSFVPVSERVGSDYVREVGPASRVLEDVIGSTNWWVGYDGKTNVGPRSASTPLVTDYEVLAYDPVARLITLAVDDLTKVGVGSIISERLDSPQTIREFRVKITATEIRMHAWCGGDDSSNGRLSSLVKSLVSRSQDSNLFGAYRYRVSQMSGQRVILQAVRKAAGLPDLGPTSMWPGIAGVHAQLALGAEVLVQFVEGDRTMPVITHFAGADGKGFVPTSLTLGGDSGAPVARQGDTVEILLPPLIFSGTISGAPASGVMVSPLNKALGTITMGSSKVKAAT